MKKFNKVTIALASGIFIFSAISLQADPDRQAFPELMFNHNLAPANRLQIGFRDQELDQHGYYERYQTAYVSGEYAIFDSWSVYGSIPYSKRWLTDADTRHRLDNILLGTRLGWDLKRWMPAIGLQIELATGDEKDEGIGSKELGSLEPYLGIMYARNFIISGAVRFNAETNKQFKEKEEQHFRRTWHFDLATGYRFEDLDLLLEYTYKYRQDPELDMISTHVIAPAIHYRFTPSVQLGLSLPYSVSKEREYDFAWKVELTVFY